MSDIDNRTRVQVRRDVFLKYVASIASTPLGNVLLVEYPKSGASWCGQMLEACTGMPHWRTERTRFRGTIVQSHFNFNRVFGPTVYVARDYRDVLVSLYHHFYFENERSLPGYVERMRELAPFSDFADVAGNLVPFIGHVEKVDRSSKTHAPWAEHTRSWMPRRQVVVVRYESLLHDASAALRDVTTSLGYQVDPSMIEQTVADFSFERQTGRPRGSQPVGNAFARRGAAGTWREYFNTRACVAVDASAGDQMRALGYLTRRASVEELSEAPE